MNLTRFKTIIDRIKANPACHDQKTWHCGTAHCLAGHAQIDAGKKPSDSTVRKDARLWLELSDIRDADWLFSSTRTVGDFEHVLTSNGVIFDSQGYDRDGFNSDGFNSDGFNRDGYDRDGFNSDGYDRDGRDRDGFNRDGFNRDGRDRDGRDRYGRDRDGYDRDGFKAEDFAAEREYLVQEQGA